MKQRKNHESQIPGATVSFEIVEYALTLLN